MENSKVFATATTGPISTKLGTNHPCVKGTQVFTNTGPINSQKGNYDIFLLSSVMV